MDKQTLVAEINKILKAKWSDKQVARGKWIEVEWAWVGIIGQTVHKYRECGWRVTKQVELGPEGRRAWLVFINPHWIAKGDKIRDHLPY